MAVRPIVLDGDPGIDEAVALALALFDPRLDVLAVTAVEGVTTVEQATRNVVTILDRLDPPRTPRLGSGTVVNLSNAVEGLGSLLHGPDGLGGTALPSHDLLQTHPAEKVLQELIRQYPSELTIVCTGPLSNIARLLRREPPLAGAIGRLIITGGTFAAPGNVTPVAEFNIFHDPVAAKEVFAAPLTKTLLPLDVIDAVAWDLAELDACPPADKPAGELLRQILPAFFRRTRANLGTESVTLPAVLAMLLVLEPGLFTTQEYQGDVETESGLTAGMTVFDRRPTASPRGNIEVVTEVDSRGVLAAFRKIFACLA